MPVAHSMCKNLHLPGNYCVISYTIRCSTAQGVRTSSARNVIASTMKLPTRSAASTIVRIGKVDVARRRAVPAMPREPAREFMVPHRIGQRIERRRRLADPARQRRTLLLRCVPREDSPLSVQRKMIAVLRLQHMSEQIGARPPALDRARRQRRLVEALAPGAGHTWAHDALDEQPGRNVLQLLGGVFAQALEVSRSFGILRNRSPSGIA